MPMPGFLIMPWYALFHLYVLRREGEGRTPPYSSISSPSMGED
jgi:hypothetical protein